LDQTGVESVRLGIISRGGADGVIRVMMVGTMIRHAFCSGGVGVCGQTPPVSALAVAMVEATFL